MFYLTGDHNYVPRKKTWFKYKPLQRINTGELGKLLEDHPDQELVKYLLDGYTKGFKLGLTRFPNCRQPCKNPREALRNPEIVQELIDKEVRLGHMLGPFDNPPFEQMVFSPINIVPKAGSVNKYRLIHDLKFPYNDQSVNSCIPEENSTVKYHHIDEVIEMALAIGTCVKGARCDIEAAFRHQSMHFSQLFLLGFTFNEKFYINSSLPFGAASSCQIFEKVACALQWIITDQTGRVHISHFLDDFPLLGVSHEDVCLFIVDFYTIMDRIGMPVAKEKTLGPTDMLEYLGLVLNFVAQRIEIPEKKRQKCIDLIAKLITCCRERKRVTVKTIQQTAGTLNFICQALPAGRPFLCSLYKLTRTHQGARRAGGHHRRISNEVCKDLEVLQSFLQEKSEDHVKSVPFLARLRLFNDQISLFADAAGGCHLGMGCTYGVQWRQGLWSETELFKNNFKPNIALLELLAIVAAVETWAQELAGKHIILRSDNAATVAFINKMKSDIPAAMDLLRQVSKTCLSFQIWLKAEHLAGVLNVDCDHISRNRLDLFFKRNPTAPRQQLPLPRTIWPPTWTPTQMTATTYTIQKKRKGGPQ